MTARGSSPVPSSSSSSHSTKHSQYIQPGHVGSTWKATQTSRPRQSSRYGYTIHASIPRQPSQSKPPSRYRYPTRPGKSNLSMVIVRGGPTITLTSNKPIRREPRYPITYKIGSIVSFVRGMPAGESIPRIGYPPGGVGDDPIELITTGYAKCDVSYIRDTRRSEYILVLSILPVL